MKINYNDIGFSPYVFLGLNSETFVMGSPGGYFSESLTCVVLLICPYVYFYVITL